jgi:enoyl-CoA hydratase
MRTNVDERDESAVLFEIVGDHTAVITINRPEVRNAINGAVARGIEAAVDKIESDPTLWTAVLTGAPPLFSAGADLKEINAGRRDTLRTTRGGFGGLVARSRTKPLIAAVDGHALAGGMELCLACDLVVASSNSQFGVPEVKRSLVAAAGGLFRLPQRLPLNVALELALTGDSIGAERAHQLGLVNHLTQPGGARARALELADTIAQGAPVAVRASRRVMLAAVGGDDALGWRLSAEAMDEAMASVDASEGVAAFIEKRAPQWSGA